MNTGNGAGLGARNCGSFGALDDLVRITNFAIPSDTRLPNMASTPSTSLGLGSKSAGLAGTGDI
jgi:hypothetical protein